MLIRTIPNIECTVLCKKLHKTKYLKNSIGILDN